VYETEQEDFNSFLKEGAEKIKFNYLKKIAKARTLPAADREADVRALARAKPVLFCGRQAGWVGGWSKD